MRDSVKIMIARIEGGDMEVLDLMFLAENSRNMNRANGDADDQHLSLEEQAELVYVLLEMAETLKPEYSSLLWVVGKASPVILMGPVQDFILTYARVMPREMLYQSLVALQNCLVTQDSEDFEAIKQDLKYEQMKATLNQIETQDDRLQSILRDMLSNLEMFHLH